MRRDVRAEIEAIYRTHSRGVLATLLRMFRNLDTAEEALQESFAAALKDWPRTGMPANPFAWLVSAGRFRQIDRLRREKRAENNAGGLASELDAIQPAIEPAAIADDELRLIFLCCHPALSSDSQVALTLRDVAGLTTEQIASAYLTRAATVAQRIVRAKTTLRNIDDPFAFPARPDIRPRLANILRVIYLIFNEGYFATSTEELIRVDLCSEAIRLVRLLNALVDDSEAQALLALFSFSRSEASRTGGRKWRADSI